MFEIAKEKKTADCSCCVGKLKKHQAEQKELFLETTIENVNQLFVLFFLIIFTTNSHSMKILAWTKMEQLLVAVPDLKTQENLETKNERQKNVISVNQVI